MQRHGESMGAAFNEINVYCWKNNFLNKQLREKPNKIKQ